jgi:glucose-1-phosphate cytidylyltransferase
MNRRKITSETAVILCGGKGQRLGSLGVRLPKALVPVHGRPIIWYTLMRLHQDGFRDFVLPLGYLGAETRKFFDRHMHDFDAHVKMIDTGDETPVARRMSLVRHAISSDNFMLVNGDTLFDFDLADLMAKHRSSCAELTLTSCQVISQHGMLLLDNSDRIVDFVRDSTVDAFVVRGRERQRGLVNSGIVVLRRQTLDIAGIEDAPDFEQFLYPRIIARGGARHYAINGYWHAIDTEKD